MQQSNRSDYDKQYKELNLDNLPISTIVDSSRLRSIICDALNYEQVIPNEDGLNRDYRGLAELLNLPFNVIQNLERSPNRMLNILIHLKSLSAMSSLDNDLDSNLNNNHQTEKIINRFCTIELLVRQLEKLERYDVIDDLLDELKSNPIDESSEYFNLHLIIIKLNESNLFF